MGNYRLCLEELELYIYRRQNMVVPYIATNPILDLCLEVDRSPLVWLLQRWLEQEYINFVGAREAVDADKVG